MNNGNENTAFSKGSELAETTRRAREHMIHLEQCGEPVFTADRVAARKAWEDAKEAERVFWEEV